MDNLSLFKKKFDLYLKEFFEHKINDLTAYTNDPSILDYLNYVKKITLTGGKRIRPYIAYLMYRLFGGKEEGKILEYLTAIEMLHSFCLVHDDIMDNGTLRHGIKTSHVYIAEKLIHSTSSGLMLSKVEKLKKENKNIDYLSIGKSQAILLGDLLISWANEIINTNTYFKEQILTKVKNYFYKMVDEVAIGQMIDVDLTTRKKVAKDLIDQKILLKTASYSFIRPMQLGIALAGKINTEIEKLCEELGTCLGIAFQTQDDLFDMTLNEKELHKTVSSDATMHQHTYLTELGIQEAKRIIENNFKKAKAIVQKFPVLKESKQKLMDFIETISSRTY